MQINEAQPNPTREAEAPAGRGGAKKTLVGEGDFACWILKSNPIRWHTEGRDKGCLYIADRMSQRHTWMAFESSISDLRSYVIWVGGV